MLKFRPILLVIFNKELMDFLDSVVLNGFTKGISTILHLICLTNLARNTLKMYISLAFRIHIIWILNKKNIVFF